MLNQPPRQLFVTLALIGLAWLPLAGEATAATGSGKLATETRALPDFQAIELSGSMDLKVRQGSPQSVQVQADDNLVSQVLTEVEGDTLVIKTRPGHSMRSRQPLLVTVGAPYLAGVDMLGSGDVWVQGIKGERFELQLSGSGDARLSELALRTLTVGLAGSGDITAQGRCDDAQLSIAGSGDLSLADLVTLRTTVSIAGSGDARVHATQAVTASIAGSGEVNYSGNPGSVKSNVAGSGSVTAVR